MPGKTGRPRRSGAATKSKKVGGRDGIELQDIVKRIEQSLGPDCTVTSPAFLKDKTTGDKREIDVLIQRKVASQEITIIEECRDHGRKVTIQFVEQVAAKRIDVNAHQAVIISTAGFSDGAKKKALFHGISLLTIQEAMNETWEWLAIQEITSLTRQFEILHFDFFVGDDAPDEPPTGFGADGKPDLNNLLFKSTGELWGSVTKLINLLAHQNPSLYGDVVGNAPPKVKTITVTIPAGDLFLKWTGRVVPLHKMNLKLKVWIDEVKLPLRRLKYAGDGRGDVQYADAVSAVPLEDGTFTPGRLIFVNDADGVRVSLETPLENGLGLRMRPT